MLIIISAMLIASSTWMINIYCIHFCIPVELSSVFFHLGLKGVANDKKGGGVDDEAVDVID